MYRLKIVMKVVETRNTVDHWEDDTMIDTVHEKVIVTLVEIKSVCARVANVSHKSSVLVRNAVSKFLQAHRVSPLKKLSLSMISMVYFGSTLLKKIFINID